MIQKSLKDGWCKIKLKEVCREITVGHVGSMAKEYVDEGIPFLRSQNILPFSLELSSVKYVTPEFHGKLRKSALLPGDVAVVRTGYPGTACVIPSKLSISNCADLVIIRPSEEVNAKYLTCVFNSTWGQGTIAGTLVGVAQQHFNVSAAKEMKVNLPPRQTQDKIAAIIYNYNDLIENNTRRIEILEEMARSLYREWFVNFRFPGHEQVKMVDSELGLIPEGWEFGRLDDALILQRGFDLPTKQRKEGSIPIYASTGITGTHNEAKVKAPGVVTGRSGSLGTVIYVDEDFWPLNTTLWVKEFRRVTPLYAFYLLSDLKLEQYNSGAAVPTLNRNDIHGLPVVLPPQRILEQFNQFVEALIVLKKNLIKRNDNLRQTRDLLLPKLISGEIDVEKLDINTGEVAA